MGFCFKSDMASDKYNPSTGKTDQTVSINGNVVSILFTCMDAIQYIYVTHSSIRVLAIMRPTIFVSACACT